MLIYISMILYGEKALVIIFIQHIPPFELSPFNHYIHIFEFAPHKVQK